MPLPGSNCVVDISHYSKVSSVAQVKSDGIAAVICKATEGAQIVDKTYAPNRKAFKPAGFKWGSYHFSSGDPAILQAENYLSHADPQNDELICLDYEPSFRGPNMTFDQMMEFITILHRETDRYPMIYGGSLLRETLAKQSDPILAQCPLWYAYYPTRSDHPIACRNLGRIGPSGNTRTAITAPAHRPSRASAIATGTPTTERPPTCWQTGRSPDIGAGLRF